MIFLYYFEATFGIVFGSLCAIAAFIVMACALAYKAEQWWLRYEDRKWERW